MQGDIAVTAPPSPGPRPPVVVMGVAGCGKSTVGRLLADRLAVPFAEGDSFHPPANVARMSSGRPLRDTDRYPWLAVIADWIRGQAGVGGVVTCSALKVSYRNQLRAADPGLWFLHLAVDRDTAKRRVTERVDHFMPASLVDSQFQVLEPLTSEESGLVVDATAGPEEILRRAVASLTGTDFSRAADPAARTAP